MTVLELGGGTAPSFCKAYNSGINIDILDSPLVDIKHDLRKTPYPIGDQEYEMIYSKFFLEHVPWRQLSNIIKEVYRILKPEGRAIFIVPNFREQVKMVSRTKEFTLEPITQMIFGDQNYEDDKWMWNAHASSTSPELYEKLFKQAGFRHFHHEALPQWIADMELTIIK